MKYVSLDLETTGLRPGKDLILQIAMVVEDSLNLLPIEQLPRFVKLIKYDEIVGQPYALGMNGWIMDLISGRSKHNPYGAALSLDFMVNMAESFLNEHFSDGKKIVVAGKNVAGFDMPFLPAKLRARFAHRVIDAGSVFIDWSKDYPPALGDLTGTTVAHDALEDALDVIRVLRRSYK